jgi:hypothetical protein
MQRNATNYLCIVEALSLLAFYIVNGHSETTQLTVKLLPCNKRLLSLLYFIFVAYPPNAISQLGQTITAPWLNCLFTADLIFEKLISTDHGHALLVKAISRFSKLRR